MEEYIREIEQIASRHTMSQADGYSQIMRICDAVGENKEFTSKEGTASPQFDDAQDINEFVNHLIKLIKLDGRFSFELSVGNVLELHDEIKDIDYMIHISHI